MQTFTLDLSERKRILKNISSKDHTWKARMSFAVILFLAAVGIIGYTVYLLISHPTSEEGVFIFICAGICFACIPFFVALSVKNTAKYKCAFPYTAYANGSLNLYDDKLEYIFWRVGPHEPAAYSSKCAVYRAEDKFVFSIDKKDIVSIKIKDDICMIKGNGIVKMPEWAIEDAAVKIKNKEFSFIMAFEQKDTGKIIEKWVVD